MISLALTYIKSIFVYWKLIVVGLILSVIIGMSIYIYIENLKIINMQSKLDLKDIKINALNADIQLSNNAILKNKIDYETKLKQLPNEIIKIHTVYIPKYQTIETITEDKNDTCEQMVAKLNDTDL